MFPVTLKHWASERVRVDFSTSDGTAVTGGNRAAGSHRATFPDVLPGHPTRPRCRLSSTRISGHGSGNIAEP